MNSICKKILENIKEELPNDQARKLSDKIVSFGGDVRNLSLEFLLEGWNEADDAESAHDNIAQPQVGHHNHPQDYRIQSLELHNFRTFPHHENSPYGISFVKKNGNESCSVFLVGKNGTGKSTLFDALEWIYTGKVRNAENRGIQTLDELKAYLTYGFGKIETIPPETTLLKAKIAGTEKCEWGLNDITPLCVPAICCSDMDIEEISKFGEDIEEAVGNLTEDKSTRFQRFIRCQLGYEELTSLHKRLDDIGKNIQNASIKIERRKTLALLTATDLKRVRQYLKVLCFETPNDIQRVRKYSKTELISKCSSNKSIPSALRHKKYPFKDLWIQLQENVKLRDELLHAPRGLGFIQEGTRPSVEDIGSRINSAVNHLTAIHNRLNKALDEVLRDVTTDGYNDAITALNSDIRFVESECGDLPDRAIELNRIQVKYKLLGDAMLALDQKLIPVLAHLFEKKEEGDNYQNKFPERLNGFVKQVLNHYCGKDEEFDVESTANSFEVIIRVKDDKGLAYETTPQKYLNTFRFRLYAVLLKIALAFYYMKENNCLAPIIIDDVFNASDFENSVSLGHFVHNVYDVYQEVLGYKMPLQMIVLTHDEMIVNAFQNGVKMKSRTMLAREGQGYANHERYSIFGRLFPFTEAEIIFNEMKRKKQSRNEEFLNLYLEIGS